MSEKGVAGLDSLDVLPVVFALSLPPTLLPGSAECVGGWVSYDKNLSADVRVNYVCTNLGVRQRKRRCQSVEDSREAGFFAKDRKFPCVRNFS